MRDIRSAPVRGPYHRRLVQVLVQELARQDITQESLAAVLDMHQTHDGAILKRDAGTFDLDEADLALTHVGSSLKAFVADPANAVTRAPAKVSPVAVALAQTVRDLDDDELRVVLGAARAVRARSRRIKKRPARRRVAVQPQIARKTGEKR